MLANDPSSSMLERVYEQSVQETSAILPLPFMNMDPSKLSKMYTCTIHEHGPKQAIENVHMHSVSSGTT